MPGYLRSLKDIVTEVVQDSREPLSVDQIVREAEKQRLLSSGNPKNSIRNALQNSPLVESLGDGRYVYAPRAASGSSFRILLDGVDEFAPILPIGDDVGACLSIGHGNPWGDHEVALRLSTWLTVAGALRNSSPLTTLTLPGEFWTWLAKVRRDGADSLVLRCEDGETGAFTLEGSRLADVDSEALAGRDEQVLAVARGIFSRTSDVYLRHFLRRLIVRAAYKGEPQPSPLNTILFVHDGRFVYRGVSVGFRGDLTPELMRLFGERLRLEHSMEPIAMEPVQRMRTFYSGRGRRPDGEGAQGQLEAGGAPAETEDEEEVGALGLLDLIPGLRLGMERAEEEAEGERRPQAPAKPAEHLYRLRVRLRWKPSVWRVIEILDNQNLVDLHHAIQEAFAWDNDHLWAYFLSGKRWDSLTEIASPAVDEGESPFADEVTIGDLELKRGQKFLYLFDFGDELQHDVELIEVVPLPPSGDYPRVAVVHGEAPPQYPGLDEEEEDEEESDEDGLDLGMGDEVEDEAEEGERKEEERGQ
jgi:hypothetical protein